MACKGETVGNELGKLIEYFFREYLPVHRGASHNTIKSYRDTLTLFLSWLKKNGKPADARLFSDLRPQDILEFLKHLERGRSNSVATRNVRLAAIKSFFFMCYLKKPETKPVLEIIQFIPMKKASTPLLDYFEHEDVLKILGAVDRSTATGAKDYVVLNLLYDTGVRASELAGLTVAGFDPAARTLEILGKGSKWRKIRIWPRTALLLKDYLQTSRATPKPLYRESLIVNQRGERLTRFGVHKICQKYLMKAGIARQLPSAKRSAVHSWRHTAAVTMIRMGHSLLSVRIRLGHSQLDTTQKYLNLDLASKKMRVDELVRFTEGLLPPRPRVESPTPKTTEQMLEFLKSL